MLKTLHLTTEHHNVHKTLSIEDYHYSKETLITSGFLSWVETNRPILQGIITIPSPQRLQKDPLRFVSMLLARLGLKQKRVGRAIEGVYHLDVERINLLNALIMRREKGLFGVTTPLDTSSCAVKEPTTAEFFIETFKKIKQFFTLEKNDSLVFV